MATIWRYVLPECAEASAIEKAQQTPEDEGEKYRALGSRAEGHEWQSQGSLTRCIVSRPYKRVKTRGFSVLWHGMGVNMWWCGNSTKGDNI